MNSTDQAKNTPQAFKIVFAGEARSGKTAFLVRSHSSRWQAKYSPTLGVEIIPLRFETSRGPIVFNVWDTAGDPRYSGLGIGGYGLRADGAVLFHSALRRGSQEKLRGLRDEVTAAASRGAEAQPIPVVLCSSMADMKSVKIDMQGVSRLSKDLGCAYYQLSAKSCYNFEKPFLQLARELLRDPSLVFVGADEPAPRESQPHEKPGPRRSARRHSARL